MIKILLICGSGASSGFMVQSMLKNALSRKIDVDLEARGDSQLKSYIDKVDVVLAGPHLRVRERELTDFCKSHNRPFTIIDASIYGRMDGEKALDLALKTFEDYKEKKKLESENL